MMLGSRIRSQIATLTTSPLAWAGVALTVMVLTTAGASMTIASVTTLRSIESSSVAFG